MPAARAASSREEPSRTSARASIRRAARASRHRLASRRSSPAPGSFRVIATVMAPSADRPHRRSTASGAARLRARRRVSNSDRWYQLELPERVAVLGLEPDRGRRPGELALNEAPPAQVAVDRGALEPADRGPHDPVRRLDAVPLEQLDGAPGREVRALAVRGPQLQGGDDLAVALEGRRR